MPSWLEVLAHRETALSAGSWLSAALKLLATFPLTWLVPCGLDPAFAVLLSNNKWKIDKIADLPLRTCTDCLRSYSVDDIELRSSRSRVECVVWFLIFPIHDIEIWNAIYHDDLNLGVLAGQEALSAVRRLGGFFRCSPVGRFSLIYTGYYIIGQDATMLTRGWDTLSFAKRAPHFGYSCPNRSCVITGYTTMHWRSDFWAWHRPSLWFAENEALLRWWTVSTNGAFQ